ncbi:MAG: polysaccharide biosynthesis/export family protein [Alphaproteobacteria bacterium]|nr:polysaccharide biosynthesis/export family protein [Alphaproteobacteria bacterium]
MSRSISKIIVFLALLLASCTSIPSGMREYNDPILTAKPHTILAGEQIKITVFGQTDLSNTYRVNDRGQISMPLLGVVATFGKTPTQLSEYIAYLLSQQYLRNPSVSAEITTYTPIYIVGAVKSAGQFAFTPGVTAAAAIAGAGGFLRGANLTKVRLTRRDNGKVFEANVALQTPLAAGDIVQVFGPLSTTQ